VEAGTQERRSLKYIRLAAFLAGQPTKVGRVVMTLKEVEDLVGQALPFNARFPSWWRNDQHRMHSRAWLTAGWTVEEMIPAEEKVTFLRAV
jgi:hypothetical protein